MEYLITFLEGVISFISPCMLPMLPLYLSYFGGVRDERRQEGQDGQGGIKISRTVRGAAAFVTGFTIVFCLLGLFAGTIGKWLLAYQSAVNLVAGVAVILFGLVYLDVLRLPFLRGIQVQWEITGMLSAFVFGMIFAVSLTPCVGAFLGAALMMAGTAGTSVKGVLLLLVYSMGLGIPFLVSAVLLEQLRGSFAWIKTHYRIINWVCGIFLIVVGVFMAVGKWNLLLRLFSGL
ncbi:MAG: sulfite exporter TauE/SafE family protein [Lachnospiraceae bacterium]|nr:sulfite exporter TauE/SafE family protein [Lachnospiraceae bacterium]